MSVAVEVVNAGDFRRTGIEIHAGFFAVIVGPAAEVTGNVQHVGHEEAVLTQFVGGEVVGKGGLPWIPFFDAGEIRVGGIEPAALGDAFEFVEIFFD